MTKAALLSNPGQWRSLSNACHRLRETGCSKIPDMDRSKDESGWIVLCGSARYRVQPRKELVPSTKAAKTMTLES